jgi:uncharacterized protein YqiB (DUF1249 family)
MLNRVRPINKSLCLQMLCEENYALLVRLIPSFKQNSSNTCINFEILDAGPFTYTLALNNQELGQNTSSPNFKCRVYLDTKSVEVISIEGHSKPAGRRKESPRDTLNKKWTLNYFLEKWLTFQLNMSAAERSEQLAINA